MVTLAGDFPGRGLRPPFLLRFEPRQDYLYYCCAGSFDAEAARSLVEAVTERLVSASEVSNVVVDFRSVEIDDPAIVDVLTEAVRQNAPYVRRSAFIGAHGVKRVLFEGAAHQAGRLNIRVVRTLEEALAYLHGEEVEGDDET